ncbi:hypothetical protein OG568_57705 (plasmid) [Streptomyces sp. NBC_01450]|uniref:hypothetical protein n=1 Tax=Streptomyces sp. NBC_01450 TaxID=2903871 RepID=UPI002E3386B9|nr:hypothetical protein [Streptomyces sp. NBC_01450]
MRARLLFTGIALGVTMLVGGTATAQAETSAGGTVATAQAASASSEARVYTDMGTFRTEAACRSVGRAGVYSDWYCQKSSTTSNYHLWVNLDS